VDPTAFLVTFATILPAELPDKTFVATVVLSTRYRPLVVWLAVGAAFAVQCAIAVTAGQLLALLPRQPVLLASAALFATGSVIMFRAASRHQDPDEMAHEIEDEQAALDQRAERRHHRAFAVSFGLLFAAEWGDLSQLATAALSARFDAPLEVFLGAWVALLTVAGVAVLAGRWLTSRLHPAVIQRTSGSLLAVLAVITLVEAVRT
jgi:putative Ca2+/H+ antiporter (TMEM165/GDT1 family)